MLTHLQPGTDPSTAEEAARHSFDGPVSVAGVHTVVNLENG